MDHTGKKYCVNKVATADLQEVLIFVLFDMNFVNYFSICKISIFSLTRFEKYLKKYMLSAVLGQLFWTDL
jgi:hypothetical protein